MSNNAVLAIDTATAVFSVALSSGAEQWYFEADAGTRHSQLIMEITDFLLKKAGIKPGELSLLACMKGPGSFTGLRIGMSAVKGLALSLGLPFISVPSLDCMAYPCSFWPSLVLPAIDAKKKSYYCALYLNGTKLTADMDADSDAIAAAINEHGSKHIPGHLQRQVLVTGPDAGNLHNELSGKAELENFTLSVAPGCRSGSARELLAIAKMYEIPNNESIDYNCGPEYIRKSDAEQNTGIK